MEWLEWCMAVREGELGRRMAIYPKAVGDGHRWLKKDPELLDPFFGRLDYLWTPSKFT